MADFDESEISTKLNVVRESLTPSDSKKDSEVNWVPSDTHKESTSFGIVGTSKESLNKIFQYSESTSDSEFHSNKIVSGQIQKSPKTCFDEQIMNFSAINNESKPSHGEIVGANNFCKSEVNKSNKTKDKDISADSALRKMRILLEAYTESSSSSETQLSPPLETLNSPQNNSTVRTDFKNAICKETNELPEESIEKNDCSNNVEPVGLVPSTPEETKPTVSEISIISHDENTDSAPVPEGVTESVQAFIGPVFPPSLSEAPVQSSETDSQLEVKIEQMNQQPELPPQPVPVIPPAPRKRGRPRKQVLPAPVPTVEWPPGQEPKFEVPKGEKKRTVRTEKRQGKRRKLEGSGENKEEKKRQKSSQAAQKKKKRSTYIPKKKLVMQRKKHSEMENIQNFEEETRMSASEGHTGFSSRSGAMGDESQSGSMTTEGHTKSSINKKGRMEVGTDGCKPVTVQQIVEYYWPPPSSLPYGEKSDALMIQEQICEYLGCKSFKRKYPSIKRRPVDMEERTYLQENGYVSENMCDMGLTAVLAADIIEIMYNDFPHKFEEYRKYSREKKVKEQRALREKQAAERADMDPKKEALESAQSWNSELNKTRRFRILHCNPQERFFTEGNPCPAFQRIVITCASNNISLCAEDEFWTLGLFSNECEVSANTKLDEKKNHLAQNFWMFVGGFNS